MWADRWLCPDSAESQWIKIKVSSCRSIHPSLEMFLVYNLMFTNLANDGAEQTVFNKPDWKISTKSVKSGCFSPPVLKCNLTFYMEIQRVGQMLLFLTWLLLCRAHINTFYWCFPDVQTLREIKKKKKGHLCVFSCVSAAHRCVWTSSHRTSSCKQKVAPLNASAGVLAGATSFRILSHSPQCGRCAASFSPCWILW